MTFLPYHALDPYIRTFASYKNILTIGTPAYRRRHPPLDRFRGAGYYPATLTVALCQLQRALHGSAFVSLTSHRRIKAGVSVRYPLIPPVGISVLQVLFINLLSILNILDLCTAFSSVNKSHGNSSLRPFSRCYLSGHAPVPTAPWRTVSP